MEQVVADLMVEAQQYLIQSKFDLAEAKYREIIAQFPDCYEAYNDLGSVYFTRNQVIESIEYFKKAIEINRDYSSSYYNLGYAYYTLDKKYEAEKIFKFAIKINPQDYNSLLYLGIINYGKDTPESFREAKMYLCQSLKTNSNFEGAYQAFLILEVILQIEQNYTEAEALSRYLIQLNPNFPGAYNNLGNALQAQLKFDEAFEAFDKAIALNPNFGNAYHNMAVNMTWKRNYPMAYGFHKKSIQLEPDNFELRRNFGYFLLLMGDYENGWHESEARLKPRLDMDNKYEFPPLWKGEPLGDKRIFIRCEQGLGDVLQFIRYIDLLREREKECQIYIEIPRALKELLCNYPGIDGYTVLGEYLPEFDYYAYLLSLPYLFKTNAENIPNKVPYIALPKDINFHLPCPVEHRNKKKIGLVWAGNPRHLRGLYRSCSIHDVMSFFDVPNTLFYSLQIAPQAADIKHVTTDNVVDLSKHLKDFACTAAAIKQMDLIITVDTSVAHLAGALGANTWAMLCYNADWRWGINGSDCSWYPTMKLFRQNAINKWDNVIEEIKKELIEFCSE
ncbi:MAG: glycosyl transferase group 1 [Chlamydiales bacterium]|jgi:tetratricopeptide (TPR) repeat protein|nr:glycosyl transferase group 1 [Chlamydiales bacterium]